MSAPREYIDGSLDQALIHNEDLTRFEPRAEKLERRRTPEEEPKYLAAVPDGQWEALYGAQYESREAEMVGDEPHLVRGSHQHPVRDENGGPAV
jgi:hypothetical protein